MDLAQRLGRQELVVVTGKGGVEKTTLSLALGTLLAAHGRRVVVLETEPRESLHQLVDTALSGSAALGRDAARSVAGETGEAHDLRRLHVADASTFPTSSGVNPMITIMATADHVARAIADAW